MITISLVNIDHLIQLQNLFLMVRAFKIHSLSNFQVQYGAVTIVTVLYITPDLILLLDVCAF